MLAALTRAVRTRLTAVGYPPITRRHVDEELDARGPLVGVYAIGQTTDELGITRAEVELEVYVWLGVDDSDVDALDVADAIVEAAFPAGELLDVGACVTALGIPSMTLDMLDASSDLARVRYTLTASEYRGF